MNEYQNLENVKEDRKTVRLLRDLFAGKDGELTGINTYVFQSLIESDANIAKTIEEISLVEMQHLELIGKAIVAFGGLPYYVNSHNVFWSAKNVNYTLSTKKFLQQNINAEEMAIKDYTKVIAQVENESLKILLGQIIEDEKRHVEIFKEIYKNLV